MNDPDSLYTTERRETIAEVPGLRVRLLELSAGQCVPWHRHTLITDTFFCMQGPLQVATRGPGDTRVHVLRAGETLAVEPGLAHRVTGVDDGPCTFMIVQGVGEYDYVPLEDDA